MSAPIIEGQPSKPYTFKEWPKMVKGRRAASAEDGRFLLSHAEDCGIHAQVAHPSKPGVMITRPADVELKCSCGGIEPPVEDLEAAGIGPKPAPISAEVVAAPKRAKPRKRGKKTLSEKQKAALDRVPGDGKTSPGGAPKGGNQKKKTAS